MESGHGNRSMIINDPHLWPAKLEFSVAMLKLPQGI